MPEPTLYLFDGYNVLHGGEFHGDVRELTDTLASFVAMREARDATLSAPRLLLPSIQVNIRAG